MDERNKLNYINNRLKAMCVINELIGGRVLHELAAHDFEIVEQGLRFSVGRSCPMRQIEILQTNTDLYTVTFFLRGNDPITVDVTDTRLRELIEIMTGIEEL